MEIEFFEEQKQPPIFYFVKNGDTLLKIAKTFSVSVQLIKRNNPKADELEIGDCLYIPFVNTAIHIVRPLETLSKIASDYNVTEEYIKQKNQIETIFIGQKLYI